MKKIITLCFFALSMLFGSQGMEAQNKLTINKAASEKAKELRKNIKFNTIQLEEVYQAYRTYETTYQKIINDLASNQQLFNKINLVLDKSLKEILTDEQFDNYLALYRPNQEVTN